MSQPTSESLWRRAGRFTKNLIIRDYRMWVVVTVGIAFGLFIWPTPYRYDHMIRGGNSYPVRINRLTGATDFLEWHGWLHLSAPTPPSPPASKAAKSAESAFLPGGVGPFHAFLVSPIMKLNFQTAANIELTALVETPIF